MGENNNKGNLLKLDFEKKPPRRVSDSSSAAEVR